MDEGDVERDISQLNPDKIKVYPIRWLVLAIFVACSAASGIQWTQFSIISDVVTVYYQVDATFVDWTSMLYMVTCIPLVFLVSYIMEKLGLRKTVLIGTVLICGGAWIKILGVRNPFWVAFLGQAVVALSNAFILSVPARLAAIWFGPSQVSSACSIGVFGNQLGVALGFLIPPIIVSNTATHEEQAQQFYIMFGTFAGISTVILILVITLFKDSPPSPPSVAALQHNAQPNYNLKQSLANLILNKSYMLLLTAYGINTGVFYAISTLLNQIIVENYDTTAALDAGRIGLLMTLTGLLGSVFGGFILDRYHRYKETTLVLYGLSFLGMVVFTFTLDKGIHIVYVISSLLGFFMTGLLPVGFELAAELTFPEPEGTSSGLLNLASQVFGIAFTTIYSLVFTNVGDLWANLTMSLMLALGTILIALISSDLRRQAALAANNEVEK